MDGGVPNKGGSPGQDTRAWAWEGIALAGQFYLSIAQAFSYTASLVHWAGGFDTISCEPHLTSASIAAF